MAEQRKSNRMEFHFEATLFLNGNWHQCQIRNLSDCGALVAIEGDADLVPSGAAKALEIGDVVQLSLPHHPDLSAQQVQHGFDQRAKLVRLFSFQDGKIGIAMAW